MNSSQHGFKISESHYPGRVAIDAYGNGGFKFAGMSHHGSILCLPSGVYNWNPVSHSEITSLSLEKIFLEAHHIEVLLVGTGDNLIPINSELRSKLREQQIIADSMSTGAAVRTFNVLLSENRAVATSLIAVD